MERERNEKGTSKQTEGRRKEKIKGVGGMLTLWGVN